MPCLAGAVRRSVGYPSGSFERLAPLRRAAPADRLPERIIYFTLRRSFATHSVADCSDIRIVPELRDPVDVSAMTIRTSVPILGPTGRMERT